MIGTILAVRDCIRELHEVPSGHLYARLMDRMSLEVYTQIIEILKKAGVVSESGHLLTYIGI